MNKVTAFRLGVKIFSSMLMAGVTGILLNCLFLGIGDAAWIRAIIQSIVLGIYYWLIYSTAWKDGYLEKNRVLCGFSTFEPLKGFKAGLYAIIPSYLVWALMVALRLFHVDVAAVYRFVHFFAIDLINVFMDTSKSLQELSFLQLLGSTCFLIVIPLLSGVAYLLGYKRFSFVELFVFKKKAQAPTKEASSKTNRH